MKLKFFCTQWGSDNLPFEQFLAKVKAAKYDGVELGFPFDQVIRNDMVTKIRDHGLEFIAQHYETAEADFAVHKENYRRRLENLVLTRPKFINSQTGKDFFTADQNIELLAMAHSISKQSGIDIHHETHRGKFSFAAHVTEFFLKADPLLTLTADFSHWCCVAETLLEDQQAALTLAIQRSHHIHARVGNSQRAQISDPSAPECQPELDCHLQWWHNIIQNAKQQGRTEVTITPEFGPPPYMFTLPFTEEPVASQWDLNLFMRDKISGMEC